MATNEPDTEHRSTATFAGAPIVAVDGDFDARWATWVARGRVHEQRVRRRFVVSAIVIAIGGAIAFTLFG